MPSLRFFASGWVAISLAALTSGAELQVVRSTADLAHKLTSLPPVALSDEPIAQGVKIKVDPSAKFQTILGFGGTYTEAAAYNLKRLSPAARDEVLTAYFSPTKGAGFSLLRTTINSCDASSEHYSYATVPEDFELAHFSIQKDLDNGMIPGLLAAQAVAGAEFKLFASPWTAPVWMKTTGKFNQGALRPECRAAWANYLVKYLQAYDQHGVKMWGLTPQNEPEAYEQKWDAMGWTAEEMRDFLRDHLIPALDVQAPNVKLIGYDHNKPHFVAWADTLMADKRCAAKLWGFAHHWYDGGEGKLYEPLEVMQAKYPNKPCFASEQGVFAPFLESGEPAEQYAVDLLHNLNHHGVGWVVWGMLFDAQGGPNHAQNFNHSPIMVDPSTNRIYYNPSYYYLAQVSKFIRPGARRLATTTSTPDLQAAACENPDGSQVVVVLNTSAQDQESSLAIGDQFAKLVSPAHSFTTLIVR